jgi:hypothetical protein
MRSQFMPHLILGALNLGGGEIILILIALALALLVPIVIAGLIFLLVRLSTRRQPAIVTPTSVPLPVLDQRKRDIEHIRLLAILHFVFGGLAMLGILFLLIHYFILHTVFANPDLWKSQPNSTPPPKEFFEVFVWLYVFMGCLLMSACLLNLLSGLFLLKRRHRVFSLVIAGLNCLQTPFGTALGILTILVLLRDSVRELYDGS